MDDWNTLSLKVGSLTGSTRIVQRSIKESGLLGAIDLNDLDILIEGARSKDGFVNAELRKQIWPKLLFRPPKLSNRDGTDWRTLPEHKDESQIGLDVDRSFVNYPLTVSTIEKKELRDKLKNILIRFFRMNHNLSYYQGLHDICSAILLVLNDEESSYSFFNQFALQHLRDFMLPSIDASIQTLKIIPDYLREVDYEFYKELKLDLNDNPYFCLSPVITLFAHELKTLDSLSLIFDQVLSYGSLKVILVLYVILLIKKKDVILEKLEILSEDDDTINSSDIIHNILSRFLDNVNSIDINEALEEIPKYLQKRQLESLKSFKRLNPYSVLKITNPDKGSSFRELIELQIKESEKNLEVTKLKNSLIHLNKTQIIKLSLTIGIIGIFMNLLFQTKSPIMGLNNPGIDMSRLVLNAGFIQPFKGYWSSYTKQ